MSYSLEVIEKFLCDFAPEIGGRSSGVLGSGLRSRLASLSRGELTDVERRDLAKQLLSNQKALDYLLSQLGKPKAFE
ncbi:MAG: hypothetical protein ACC661_09505 [Verrucomicrobiales bacterium]